MKKVINGKAYDSDVAELLGEYANGHNNQDWGYLEERLYRKKSGEFFLFGMGGPMTRYAVRYNGNLLESGEKILPLSIDEAKIWAERNLDGDEYEEIFGNPEPDDGKEYLYLSISSKTKFLLEKMSKEQGKNISDIIEGLIS